MADFQGNKGELDRLGVDVFALSADGEEEALAMVDEEGLDFPVGYGLDPRDIRRRYGARIDEERGHVQATGFLLRPDGTLAQAVYSTGPLGRLTAREVIATVEHRRDATG